VLFQDTGHVVVRYSSSTNAFCWHQVSHSYCLNHRLHTRTPLFKSRCLVLGSSKPVFGFGF